MRGPESLQWCWQEIHAILTPADFSGRKTAMATFVLVHGACCGGWVWKKLTPLLRAAGHNVFTPTLTGVGERAHLLSGDIDLDTHVTDIVNVLAYEDLHDVLLVGHSYAGMVITGVAHRVPNRLAQLIYLDARLPIDDDRSMRDLMRRFNLPVAEVIEARIRANDMLLLPPRDLVFGMTDAGDIAWVHDHFTPHPGKTWLEPIEGNAATDGRVPRTFIFCPEPDATTQSPQAPYADHAQREGWGYHELAGGHYVMVTMPIELRDLLSTLATETV
jgi:pimeloyl-ACP methyl ester carboxylesterase